MFQIEIEHLNKSYGHARVLKDISLQVPLGAFVALVGPSGCGKSTLLRTIAGLEKITSGTLKIAGVVVNDKPPRERDVAMVFQSYALYPHMTVEDNMTYALRLRHRPKREIAERVADVAEILGLGLLLGRTPRALSGGQRQRVAMGRAIIRDPKAFLFDEPLSNLDASLRVKMRGEIRKLHQRLGATSVYVTHDQIEAMTMADMVVVLRDGAIEQVGAPLTLYQQPVNRFVAGFIGSPAMNFVPAILVDDGNSLLLGGDAACRLRLGQRRAPGRAVLAGLRPEHLTLGGVGKAQTFAARVESVEGTGSMTFIEMSIAHGATAGAGDAVMLTLAQSGISTVRPGDRVTVGIDPADIYVFDPDSGLALQADPAP
ncbi:MAG: sn-glycerol-3-phosphate ABC transporter ATP-binding protein UgpC [Azospirillaceae bacterium]|nr:sn-glycerol-3-phosphate ABC transporter ATP-binding protein UgpC [Azospirillaceae bacterium]